MFRSFLAALLLFVLSVGFQEKGAGSKEVEIVLSDGTKFNAEILSVRDSSLVVTRQAGTSEADLMEKPMMVAAIPFQNIATVQTAGSSYTTIGLFSGMAVGCLGGCAIGSSQHVSPQKGDILGCNAASESATNQLGDAALGGLAGAVLGAAIGAGASSNGQPLISPTLRDFKVLKTVARYPSAEPDYLKTIAP